MPELTFSVNSGYGANTRQPFVSIAIPQRDFAVQLSPEAARKVALDILGAADAALGDAFLIEFMQREAGLDFHQAGLLLVRFRDYRRGRPPMPSNVEVP